MNYKDFLLNKRKEIEKILSIGIFPVVSVVICVLMCVHLHLTVKQVSVSPMWSLMGFEMIQFKIFLSSCLVESECATLLF